MMKTKKGIKIVCIILAGVLLTLFCLIRILSIVNIGREMQSYTKISIFSNISECDDLNDYIVESALNDRYIGDISYKGSFVHSIGYEQKNYDIYAYEFSTEEDALEYEEAVLGRVFKQSSVNYNIDAGFTSGSLYVRNGTNIYRVHYSRGSTNDFIKLRELLDSVFSITLRE